MTGTERHEVDGVPVLFVRATGPTRAGLMFRVGPVDETLATAGVSHLVEHLALHRQNVADYHYNGVTNVTTTQFLIEGTATSVVDHLAGVCASLRDLPVDRLAVEKKIIDTEDGTRSVGFNHAMPLWRHGARDYGLVSFPQWGMRTLDAARVREWAATRFTRGNAALWIAGEEIPAGLRLDLPDGPRWPLPAESSAAPALPAYFTGGSPAVVVDGQVPRTGPGTVFTRALDRALFRELRQNRGLSYTAAAAYSTDGRPLAMVTAVADAPPGQLTDAMEQLLAELRKLQDSDLDAAELTAIRAREIEAMAHPDVEVNLLPRRTTDLLTGFAARTSPELVQGFQDATTEDVRAVARSFMASALLLVPEGVRGYPAGFEAAPTMSRYAVSGRRFRSRADHHMSLVHGTDGVSLTTPHGPLTVLFDQCQAILRWPDGARQLIGADAIGVRIEPTLFPIPAERLARLDNAVPPGTIVDLPAREPDAIPSPSRARRLRRLVNRWLVPARAWLGRVAATRGGNVAAIVDVGLAVVAVALMATAFVIQKSAPGVAAVCVAVILISRRRRKW